MTKSQKQLFEILKKSKIPLSARELGKYCQLNRATIFRAISLFIKSDQVHQIIGIDKITRYELTSDHHHHLICNSCGRINNFKIPEKLINEAALKEKFKIKNHLIELYGLCSQCQY